MPKAESSATKRWRCPAGGKGDGLGERIEGASCLVRRWEADGDLSRATDHPSVVIAVVAGGPREIAVRSRQGAPRRSAGDDRDDGQGTLATAGRARGARRGGLPAGGHASGLTADLVGERQP